MSRDDVSIQTTDVELGAVRIRVVESLLIDDVLVNLIERELFKLSGGQDPGDTIPTDLRDALFRTGFVRSI